MCGGEARALLTRAGIRECPRGPWTRPRTALGLSERRGGYEPESAKDGCGQDALRNAVVSLFATRMLYSQLLSRHSDGSLS